MFGLIIDFIKKLPIPFKIGIGVIIITSSILLNISKIQILVANKWFCFISIGVCLTIGLFYLIFYLVSSKFSIS